MVNYLSLFGIDVPRLWSCNIGCYVNSESSLSLSSTGHISDINADDIINLFDYSELINKWMVSDVLLKEDINRDGIVNELDILVLFENWLWEDVL